MVMSYLQSQRSECKIESYYTTGKQKKIDCFSVDGFCTHCNTVFEAMGCYFHFCPCQEAKASLSEEETQRGIRKREHDELRRDYLKSKGYKIVEIWECKWWESVKEEENVRNHVRKNFPFKLPLKQESLLAKIRDGEMFGYVQCDLEVPTGLKYKFSNFPPIFKNFNVSRADIGDYMRLRCRKQLTEATSANANFKFQSGKWNNYYSPTKFLHQPRSEMYKNL